MGFNVKGKIALVTGANRGIGKAIVESLLKHGASKVYAAVRSVDSAAELVKASGGKVVAVEMNLEKPATITAAAKFAKDVQLVVNNAGVYKSAALMTPGAVDSLQYEFGVNVFGFLHVAQTFAPVLAANGGGALVQLNSVVSLRSFASAATYSASKAASYSLTQALREELKKQNTLVVSVHPGPIATDMAAAAGMMHIAEPASQVGEAIVTALAEGRFHAYTDTFARQIGAAYESFGKNVIEAEMNAG